MSVCGELASEETMDQSQNRVENEWINMATKFWSAYTECPKRKCHYSGKS
jgi:hypothetical protein